MAVSVLIGGLGLRSWTFLQVSMQNPEWDYLESEGNDPDLFFEPVSDGTSKKRRPDGNLKAGPGKIPASDQVLLKIYFQYSVVILDSSLPILKTGSRPS